MAAIAEIVDLLRAKVAAKPGALRSVNASFQFHLRGDGGGSFYVSAAGGTVEVHEGTVEKASATMTMKAADFQQVVQGKLDPEVAYMSGQLWIDGDIWMAQQLQALIA